MDQVHAFFHVTTSGPSDCVIEARGEIGTDGCQRLHEVVDDALTASPVRLIVDLAAVTWIRDSALWMLVDERVKSGRLGTNLVLRSPSPTTLAAIARTGVRDLLPIIR